MTNFKAEDVAVYLARGELPANHVIKRNLKQIREARDQMGRGSGNGEG